MAVTGTFTGDLTFKASAARLAPWTGTIVFDGEGVTEEITGAEGAQIEVVLDSSRDTASVKVESYFRGGIWMTNLSREGNGTYMATLTSTIVRITVSCGSESDNGTLTYTVTPVSPRG